MVKQILAITTCRVSTPEQELSNSLDRQAKAVKEAAVSLGATIPEDGQWSGSVSSKVGSNVKRKDLKQMLDYCKKHSQVKYLLVHEVDRFMRSVDELFYFEVVFREQVGVKIIYASQPQLNTDNPNVKLFKALEVFKAESSNVERIHKSIDGHVSALKEGRYTFGRKIAYMKGPEAGVKLKHPGHAPILQEILLGIHNKKTTPSQPLVEFNKSDIRKGHSKYKMDKFKKVVVDPYYAGVVEMDKQVKFRNENGRHDSLITLEQHYELVRIMSNRKKYQNGPRKNGNPEYPLSNLVSCHVCIGKNINRYVGFPHGNGKNPKLVYHKYRCRSCGRYLTRDELHPKIEQQFKRNAMSKEGRADFLDALNTVWKENESQSKQNTVRIIQTIESLRKSIQTQAMAAIDPENSSIKQEILANIESKKQEVTDKENELRELTQEAGYDEERFLKFAYDFIDNMGIRFLEIDKEDRLRCKQVVFPEGFYLDADNKVYTPKISPLITLQTNKKDLPKLEKSLLVRVQGL